jgi:hypothetical protein
MLRVVHISVPKDCVMPYVRAYKFSGQTCVPSSTAREQELWIRIPCVEKYSICSVSVVLCRQAIQGFGC